MFRIKGFFGFLFRRLFAHTPCKPLTREVWEARRIREERVFQVVEIPRQYVYLK